MKKIYGRLLLLFLIIFLLFSCAAAARKTATADINFARRLVATAIYENSEEWKQVNGKMASMNSIELAEFKKLLLEVLTEDPPATTSIAGTWLVYGIIYEIDDELGTLEYTTIVEGVFNWDRATSLVGATDLDFITDSGQQIPIFTTVATVDKSSAYLRSEGRRVRIYIKEEILVSGKNRNQVVKIESLY